MPAAQKFVSSEGMSGVLNLRRSNKGGRKGEGRWKKKYAVLKQDTLHLYEGHDEHGKGEDESHTVYLSKYRECSHLMDRKGRKKPGFTLIPNDASYEQWMLACEDFNQQEKWISQLNSGISGNVITIINFNLDDLKVQTPALLHLSKTRPKCKGRRAPSKRPQTEVSEGNGEVFSTHGSEVGLTSVDSGNPAKKPRSEANATSPARTPEESKAKAFFRGIGLKVSNVLTRQRSTGQLKTPQSPEPGGPEMMDIQVAPEDRMSLSALMRTLQRIEETSGTIINKAAALRVLFQGTVADSPGLGRPALEVERGLRGMTDTLDHLSLAEELQTKIKVEEEQARMTKEEVARMKREEEEAQQRREGEERKRRAAEEAEQRRRDEEEQEMKDEEDRRKEEAKLKREAEERRAKEEDLRLAEEAEAEENEMWQSEGEYKAGNEDNGEASVTEEAGDGNEAPGNDKPAVDDEAIDDEAIAKETVDDETKALEERQQDSPAGDAEDAPADDGKMKADGSEDKMEEQDAGDEKTEAVDFDANKDEPAAEDDPMEFNDHL